MRLRQAAILCCAMAVAGCGVSQSTTGGAATPEITSGTSSAPPSSLGSATSPPATSTAGECPAASQTGPAGYLSGIQFVSPVRGWVVGKHAILATYDGGRRWTVQDTGSLNLTSVDFISAQDGWAVGTDSVLATGAVRQLPVRATRLGRRRRDQKRECRTAASAPAHRQH
jgi:hypothetical protein